MIRVKISLSAVSNTPPPPRIYIWEKLYECQIVFQYSRGYSIALNYIIICLLDVIVQFVNWLYCCIMLLACMHRTL